MNVEVNQSKSQKTSNKVDEGQSGGDGVELKSLQAQLGRDWQSGVTHGEGKGGGLCQVPLPNGWSGFISQSICLSIYTHLY